MRQVPNGKRSRNRPGRNNNRPPYSNNRNQTFDSSGPEGKVRGTANQVYEKYLALARDASSSGDRVTAENFFQHAEHYFRIMLASGQQMRPRPMDGFGGDGFEGERVEGQDGQPFPGDQPQPQPQAQPVAHVGGNGNGAAAEPQEAAPQPVAERRPETPAELAQAAAANSDDRNRERVRRPRRGSAPAEA
jgi:hypothetical protein